jgi:hypothetical protein
MNTDIDETIIDELREGFAPAGYERTARSFRSPSRTPYIAAVAVIGAVAATVVVVGGDGARSPALAWSPNPTAATAADEAAARAACASPDLASQSNRVVSVQGVAVARPADGSEPLPELPGSGQPIEVKGGDVVSTGDAVTVSGASGSGGAVPAAGSGAGSLGAPPTELPPLVSLDLRGNGGLAVFADDQWTFTCMLLSSGDGFETGPIMVSPTNDLPASDTLAIVSGSQSTWADGRSLAMVSGTAPAGATKVELTLPGQPVAQADVVGGRFSIWWFGSFDPSTGSIRALDANGSELATVSPIMQK